MAKILVVIVVWGIALAAMVWADAVDWSVLVGPLTVITGLLAILMFAVGIGAISYYITEIVRFRRKLRRHRMAQRTAI